MTPPDPGSIALPPGGWLLLLLATGTAVAFLRLRPRGGFGVGVLKVLTTMLIGGVLFVARESAAVPLWPFALGIAFSALGDGFLLDGERFFLHGLVAFLVGHLAYIVGFWSGGFGLLPLVVLVGFAGGVYALTRPRLGKLEIPVLLYMSVVCVMGWKAWGFGMVAGVGASLFLLSDGLIALDRFHKPIPARHLAILSTYWVGQAGIVLAAVG